MNLHDLCYAYAVHSHVQNMYVEKMALEPIEGRDVY